MKDPFFFGYGSLVNRATHSYAHAFPAQISGWRRAWRHTTLRPVAFLTAVPAHGEQIDGLIAAVPGHDWAALDEREHAYDRHPVTGPLHHQAPDAGDVQIYAVAPQHSDSPDARHPILLSYVDVVVQGYLREYGEAGVIRFFDTTDGWDAPIKDDRSAPIYPRHQTLHADEKRLVDAQLVRVSANVVAA
ncbi:gamma-glutamylcyclotransferase family protein [Actibacterium lipolyticum]|nr:gamma-glutamylcyclotransferase family protein [Actibacterium lipolyticum]